MKLFDILLEFREKIDRFTYYGQWIDTKSGQIYPVKDTWGHEDFLKKNAKQVFSDQVVGQAVVQPIGYAMFTELAYSEEFVRVEHSTPEHVAYAGIPSALKKAIPIITTTLGQRDVNSVRFDIVKDYDGEFYAEKAQEFELPTQRQAALDYLNGL